MFTLSYVVFKWIEILVSLQLGHSVSLFTKLQAPIVVVVVT